MRRSCHRSWPELISMPLSTSEIVLKYVPAKTWSAQFGGYAAQSSKPLQPKVRVNRAAPQVRRLVMHVLRRAATEQR